MNSYGQPGSRRAIIIGAGFGGLSCAIGLASEGYEVTILEKQPTIGGKLQSLELDGYHFDRGPSTITMPHVFRSVFERAGRQMDDYVQLYELEPRTRNVFADGHTVDLSRHAEYTAEQIAAYSPEDARNYSRFLQEASAMYREADQQFLNTLLLSWRDKLKPSMGRSLLRVRPLTTLQALLGRYFRHPNTLMLLGRYATYVGASPYQAPAIFAMLAHVEAVDGVYGVYGGTSNIVRGMARLAVELGVTIHPNTEVTRIRVHAGAVSGVETNSGDYEASLVIVNGDVLSASRMLLSEKERPSLPDHRIASYEPSLSGFVTLAGVPKRYDQLLHHTVFFPEQYEPEFQSIFTQKTAPPDPTLYICHSGHSEAGMAPDGGSNLFILANAPYTSKQWNWQTQQQAYGERIATMLEGYGLTGIRSGPVWQHYTPEDIQRDTYAHRGAIYGISSNGAKQTFFRPGNRSPDVKGLWYVGGTTHPGGGTPIVTLSGQLVAKHIASQR
ncbi:phytoene desaturase family protein [Paenibacillus hunanensis]|uniref:phytoene desaturase family protein n=1 Tax=Paenibacillus hunanensis TaxID=539262 RepID=UPI002026EE4D|nr:phytoene desaturase family protein [Paenibacillus hunanensis]MCL9661806.1 phytoene desaturase family protein [Paenibacillus hunanensis]